MSQFDIVHLESYRRRRNGRFRRALALSGHDTGRAKILRDLWHAVSLAGADRGAVVWLDEYGPGLAHPHILLDLAADRPRRFFSPVPLRTAWDSGVPGLLDLPQTEGRWERMGGGIASACAVALGSDGPRSWFLVVDSLTPRRALSKKVVGELMFVAGEVASVVLHRDLDARRATLGSDGLAGAGAQDELGSFSGWPVLKDLEGCRRDDEVSRRIGNRFLVARIVRGLVEDDLVMDPESVQHQVRGVREELNAHGWEEAEARVWDQVLRAVSASDHGQLMASLLEWGREVEGQGHLNGALEILGLAYELAKAMGSADTATDAARFQGKIFRVRAEWARALAWYDIARGIAEEVGNPRKLAAVLDGLANAHRDRGNLPRARELLLEVLEIGKETGDRYTLAIAYHDLMTVGKLGDDLVGAIRHGWMAVQSYDSRVGSLGALFDLAGVLRENGELSAAKDAYTVVAEQITTFEHRLLAMDALAFISALQGDAPGYHRIRERMDEEGWEALSPVYRGQVLYYRGLSSRALGWWEESRKWLGEALAYAELHDLNKLIFDAEAALTEDRAIEARPVSSRTSPEPYGEEILEVRQGLRALRDTLADAGRSL
ncbi:MAG: tetratricopeptide repeat protein [Gemmatimonadota bacterium]